VPDHTNPEFFKKLDYMVECNAKVVAIGKMDLPKPVKVLLQAPFIERMVAATLQLFLMTPLRSGSVDVEPELRASVVY
jgi:hypothetical protein